MRSTHPADVPAIRPTLVDLPESARLARDAFDTSDYHDAYRIALSPAMPTDPRYWAREIFFRRPFPELAHSSNEVLMGDSARSLDFRVSILVEGQALTMSSVVRFHNSAGARYFAVVKPFHRRLVPMMLWRAGRRSRG